MKDHWRSWFLSIFEVGLRCVRVNFPMVGTPKGLKFRGWNLMVDVLEIGLKRALNGHPELPE